MTTKHVTTLCCLLLVLVLHSDQTSAAESCSYSVRSVPFCKSWMCKTECWLESQLITSNTIKEHNCIKGGLNGLCRCLFCEK
ncbi:hypothetical protein BDA96_06G019300 [Sorghum bicolor]|uniref:Knottin scorpion toxin-like domain-containing protein n=2 Tax=Sorghum bicolor TaxID=4558 RepID=A0A921QMY7_SORBI|nr:hypothetical protein BDA96_06G019300 [Sorghum bicolor]KXG25826.1 hypothetical protein SORBI_3006G017900 [Sorghum bicolor]